MDNYSVTEDVSTFKTLGRFFWELVKAFLIAMVIIIPIRYFLIQPFFVRGASMEPTFSDGEYLIIDQLSYRLREPRRGEVIVFRYPNRPSQFFIKRIIAMPNERVVIEGGQIVIYNDKYEQGIMVDESPYITEEVRTGGQVDIQLGDAEYFVLGDNRPASSDSRSWGSLSKDEIIGRAWIRAFPVDRIDVFSLEKPGLIGL